MSKLLRKPKQIQASDSPGRFERFNLSENPFPSDPFVNKDSTDKRINGDIYEFAIRKKEYDHIETYFLKQEQSNPNHLRLGYIIDDSYIGRGNGKSAFLVNLQQIINKDFCLDVSDGQNKCFAVYLTPEPGGRTKTFPSFVDLLFASILRSNVINDCLTILKLEAVNQLNPNLFTDNELEEETALYNNLSSLEWFSEKGLSFGQVLELIYKNPYLQDLPPAFPLFEGRGNLIKPMISQKNFEDYYLNILKKGKERLDFVFSHLVQFLLASGFNGSYVLIDDFERIPDFQSARQKRDFALELRSCLFDGIYTNARVGFYNFILVLHAGVQRLIKDAWSLSGMENRAPISPQVDSKHIISFEKLSRDHASLLIKKYLAEYRIDGADNTNLFPFTEGAVGKIGELSEYNAAKILKMAYYLLDEVSHASGQIEIDEKFVNENRGVQEDTSNKNIPGIQDVKTTDLLDKARSRE